MQKRPLKAAVFGLILGLILVGCAAPTATPVPTPTPVPAAVTPTPSPLLKAKQEAEAKGYVFETSHDEILAKAKKEGKLRTLTSWDPACYPKMAEAFKQKFPFIDIYVEELTGSEAIQRFLLELKAGAVKEWDEAHLSVDFYNQWPPYAKNFDILGMAEKGVLSIPPEMVDPNNRKFLSLATNFCAIAYNKKLIDPAKVPDKWEDLLKPEFKGKKFLIDIRAKCPASLVPLLGEDWVRDYSKKIAAQQPVWSRGYTRSITALIAGEYALHGATYWNTVKRAMDKDPTGDLQVKILEPVPVWHTEHEAVLETAKHPYAALLWLEFQASTEGQRIVDQYEPLKSSLYAPGSEVEKMLRGKELSVAAWDNVMQYPKWIETVVEAYGFPKAEISG